MTDSDDFSRLHDEPSRLLRVYPSRDVTAGAASGTSELYEDDGLAHGCLAGLWTLLTFRLAHDPAGWRLGVERSGSFDLPYQAVRIELPVAETRALAVDADAGLAWKVAGRD